MQNPYASKCKDLYYQVRFGKWIVRGKHITHYGTEEYIYLDALDTEEEVNELYPEAKIHSVYPVMNLR